MGCGPGSQSPGAGRSEQEVEMQKWPDDVWLQRGGEESEQEGRGGSRPSKQISKSTTK